MQKIYINNETNMVEQILNVETLNELPDDYFSTCYAIIDEENKVNAYNLKYNKEICEFEVIEGLKAKDEVTIEQAPTKEDYENLKKENEELNNRLDKLENLIKRMG